MMRMMTIMRMMMKCFHDRVGYEFLYDLTIDKKPDTHPQRCRGSRVDPKA